MKHKDKIKMACKMLNREERKTKHGKTSLFLSKAWKDRVLSIQIRMEKKRMKNLLPMNLQRA